MHRATLVTALLVALGVGVALASTSEYCCCDSNEVLQSTKEVLVILDSIVKHPFFRYFKVNVHRECPYWAVSLLCMGEGSPCTVCKCSAEEVPLSLLGEGDMGVVDKEDGEQVMSSSGNVQPSLVPFELGSLHPPDSGEEYIDLVKNPESNTGYVGPLANRIWEAIYRENCFDVAQTPLSLPTCTEKLVFYQLISGLQASISTHLAINFYRSSNDDGTIAFKANCDELRRRVLDHPERLENMLTLYQFVLRALTRAAGAFMEYDGYADGATAAQTEQLTDSLQRLFQVRLLCSNTFNETRLLESDRGRMLIPEMKRMMQNITTLMDCLTCEKCRVWGKLQTRGLATAFKVVMSPHDSKVSLQRGDLVALLNFARQLSFSVAAVHEFKDCTSLSSVSDEL